MKNRVLEAAPWLDNTELDFGCHCVYQPCGRLSVFVFANVCRWVCLVFFFKLVLYILESPTTLVYYSTSRLHYSYWRLHFSTWRLNYSTKVTLQCLKDTLQYLDGDLVRGDSGDAGLVLPHDVLEVLLGLLQVRSQVRALPAQLITKYVRQMWQMCLEGD